MKRVWVDPNVTQSINMINRRLKGMQVKKIRVDPYKHDLRDTISMKEMTSLPLLYKSL